MTTEKDAAALMARRLRIHGRVQGVGYRAWAEQTGTDLGLSGWVRNRTDGTVEALAVGSQQQVEAFIHACHEGPTLASVSGVQVDEAIGLVESGFVTKPTV